MKTILSILVLAIATALTPSFNLSAQTTASGGLAGVVSDPSGEVVPDALVELRDLAKNTAEEKKTDRQGAYEFLFTSPGEYLLTVTRAGFQKESKSLHVTLGPTVTVNLTLTLASQNYSVEVSAEKPLLHSENADVSTTMNQKQISELPNPGNDLTYVVQTAPGVVMNTDVQGGANFSILGMPGFSYLHTMDGMNDNDNAVNLSQIGALILLLGQNQVQEASVVATGYSGQYGGAAGGNVNYITKSGSNQFHGNAQYYWNGRVLNANDWFRNAFDAPRPSSIANQWAGSFGGPLRKGSLFFFIDSEGLRITIPQNFLVTIPSPQFESATIANIDSDPRVGPATDAFYKQIFSLYHTAAGSRTTTQGASPTDPLGCADFSDPGSGLGLDVPCSRFYFTSRSRSSYDALTSGRLDWNPGKDDRAFLRVQYDRGDGAIATDPISPLFDGDFNQPWWQGQFLETHTFGPRSANQFLVASSYFGSIFQFKNPAQALAAFPTTLNFVQGPFSGLGGIANLLAFASGRYNTQYQLSDDFAKVVGRNKLGFGAQFERIYWSEPPDKSSSVGHLDVQSLRAFYQGGIDPATPESDFTVLTQGFTSQSKMRISFLSSALYGNDEWHAKSNLTMTLALRAEHYSNPSCRNRCFARLTSPFETLDHDPSLPYNNAILVNQSQAFAEMERILWSPRLGLAWQPFGISRSLVVRAGVGVFYDPTPGGFTTLFSGNAPLLNTYTVSGNNLAPGETSSLFKDAAASNLAFTQGFATGQTLAEIQDATAKFFPPAINDPGKQTHSPQYQRWSLELQEAFDAATSLSVGYFGHHGIHGLIENPNANAFGFGSLPTGRCGNAVPDCAPDPRFSGVTELRSNAVSKYHGAVVSFQHRLSQWGQGLLQANYTYGHALDDISSVGGFVFTSATLTSGQDPDNPHGSYGSADHDVRHSFNMNYVWELPIRAVFRGHGSKVVTDGWQISGTVFARTGFPYTVFDFEESSRLTANNYYGLLYAVPNSSLGPDPPCGKGAVVTEPSRPCQPPQVLPDGVTLNPKARFIQSGCAIDFNKGTLAANSDPCGGPEVSFAQGRNRFRGPAYFNADFAIVKNTRLKRPENTTLGIGLQFFNVFNHANFGFPDAGLSSPTFGQIFGLQQPPTSILGSGVGGNTAPRIIQIKAQLQF